MWQNGEGGDIANIGIANIGVKGDIANDIAVIGNCIASAEERKQPRRQHSAVTKNQAPKWYTWCHERCPAGHSVAP